MQYIDRCIGRYSLVGVSSHLEAEGSFGVFTIELRGISLPDNPKSSTQAALSVAGALLKTAATIIV